MIVIILIILLLHNSKLVFDSCCSQSRIYPLPKLPNLPFYHNSPC